MNIVTSVPKKPAIFRKNGKSSNFIHKPDYAMHLPICVNDFFNSSNIAAYSIVLPQSLLYMKTNFDFLSSTSSTRRNVSTSSTRNASGTSTNTQYWYKYEY